MELALIDEPDLTAHTVLTTIGGREQPGRSATETILDALAGRTVLLVLDNCEHVVGRRGPRRRRICSPERRRCPSWPRRASSSESPVR